jgi:hypothetical protein
MCTPHWAQCPARLLRRTWGPHRATTAGVVSSAGDAAADAYAALGIVSRAVVAADLEAGGNTTAVADAGTAAKAGMGATVTGDVTMATVGATGVGATPTEGDADGGATGADGGGYGGRVGGSDYQGRGSRLNLASFSSRKVLLVSILQINSATMASMRRSLASSIVIGMAATLGKRGWVGWENHGRKISGSDDRDLGN